MKKNQAKELGGWQDEFGLLIHSSRRGYGAKERTRPGGRSRNNLRFHILIFWSIFAVTLARLIYLQIFEGGYHSLVSAANHLVRERQYAPRGIIYDRNMQPLVANVEQNGVVTRDYLLGHSAAHITGYIAEVVEDEVGCREGVCLEPEMIIGRAGVERVFDNLLRGKDGGRLVERDARGQEIRELGQNQSEPGQDLVLSIDSRLQRIVAEELGEKMGSAVAIDMQGKLLALVSSPSYDPNLFTIKHDQAKLEQMLNDSKAQYFLNRAIGGVYPPGSTYKIVTAYAGLATGEIDKKNEIEDTGEIRINEYRYGNWYFDQYGQTEGRINVERALARSNDIFFYKVGEMVGIDRLVEYSHKFGLGEVSGLELPGEKQGLVPTRLYKERATGEKWFLGNTYHLAIGQGDLQTTPLQVARMTAAGVSGRLCRLSLLMSQEIDCQDIGLKPDDIKTVQEGLRQVCQEGGTAFTFFDFSPPVLCKTGTAEHAGQISNELLPESEQIKPHAWITVAYPGDNPEMVLVVMLDSAGEGSREAGPVARRIIERWRGVKN